MRRVSASVDTCWSSDLVNPLLNHTSSHSPAFSPSLLLLRTVFHLTEASSPMALVFQSVTSQPFPDFQYFMFPKWNLCSTISHPLPSALSSLPLSLRSFSDLSNWFHIYRTMCSVVSTFPHWTPPSPNKSFYHYFMSKWSQRSEWICPSPHLSGGTGIGIHACDYKVRALNHYSDCLLAFNATASLQTG